MSTQSTSQRLDTQIEAMEARLRVPEVFRADPVESGALANTFVSKVHETINEQLERDALMAQHADVTENGHTGNGRTNTVHADLQALQNQNLNTKNGKKGKAKDDLLVRLHLLQRQADYWGGEAKRYQAQSDALEMAIENVQNGKDSTEGMSDEQKQNFLDAVQEYKDKYGLTDEEIDLNDPAVLAKIKKYADEKQAQAKEQEQEYEAAIKNKDASAAAELDQDTSHIGTTKLSDDLDFAESVLEHKGYDEAEQKEAIDSFSDDAVSEDVSSALSLFGANTGSVTASHASTLDDNPVISDQSISLAFNDASEGNSSITLDAELEQTPAVSPQVTGPGLG